MDPYMTGGIWLDPCRNDGRWDPEPEEVEEVDIDDRHDYHCNCSECIAAEQAARSPLMAALIDLVAARDEYNKALEEGI